MIARVFDSTRRAPAFSLIEVVVALAVLTTGVVVILSLLPGLIRRQAEAREVHVALQLPGSITAGLRQIGTGHLPGIAARLADLGADAGGSLRLVAARDGTDVRELSDAETPRRDQYFLVELYRFPAGSPLAFDPGKAALPIQVRVTWPYRPEAVNSLVETPAGDRQGVSFNVVLNP